MREIFLILRTEIRGGWRYRWQAVASAWAVCVLGWLLIFTLPDIYEARAQVFVDADSRLADVMEEVGVAPGVGSRVFVVRQAMLGRPQLERVARETDLDLRARTAKEKEKLIIGLRENIQVTTGRSSHSQNLYTITFRDPNRTMAIRVVQTLLDTFVEDVLDLKEQGMEDVEGYLEDQLSYYAGLLAEAEARLADFKKQYVGLLPGESGDIFERLQSEMDALKSLQSELAIEENRRDELRRQIRAESPYIPDEEITTATGVERRPTTNTTISDLEARRADLLLSYTEKHPDIVAINEQLAQLYQKQKAERSALFDSGQGIEGVSDSTNPVYQSVQIALNDSNVQIAALKSKIEQHSTAVKQFTDQVNTIPEVEAKYSELTRNYAQYTVLYNELLMQKERERMGSVGEERDVVSFNIIDPPLADIEPVAPNRILFLFSVLLIGLGFGGAVAYGLHKMHPVFHDARSIREVTGRPVLGLISMTWLERHREERVKDISSFIGSCLALIIVFIVIVAFQDVAVDLMYRFLWQQSS